jgi:hypothetical protein|tara:strand:+ start:92 stop:217 length:126 start_codon:yes stop_codon:yes gene_type:complete
MKPTISKMLLGIFFNAYSATKKFKAAKATHEITPLVDFITT